MSFRSLSRRRLAITALCLAASGTALAQGKTTRLIVAFPPGGPVDFVARAVGEQLGKELGQTVIIDNKPGGNGAVAASDVMRSAADGTTLWITSVGAVAVNPALYEKLGYDVNRDLAPVSLVANNVELLVVNKSDPANSAAEFVANSKKARQPVAMGSSGIGSIPHLAILQLQDASGANLLHVPYKGAAPAINDVIGGQLGGFFGDIPGLIGHVRGGTLKAIGLASTQRHPALPEVKTLAEQGIPNVDTNNWYAIFASAKTPPAVIDNVNKALKRALDDKGLRDKLLNTGAEPVSSSPQELAALLKKDGDKWARLIRAKNIKPE
jgi:tripartite-type tricarboxylate transporter receptor subunit TctC